MGQHSSKSRKYDVLIEITLNTYKRRSAVDTKHGKHLVKGRKEGRVEDRPETHVPLPGQIAVAKGDPVPYFESLPVLVWAEVGLDETGIDGTVDNETRQNGSF